MTGRVFLVGAGPGDPVLLTVRGRACLEAADVILYDSLVDERVLRWARADAERVEVGKRGDVADREAQQAAINRRMVAEAREGKTVVRLKGGDPFVFGRGGEEARVLAGEGIPFEVVPGVTSAIAAPAYAGIPITHRGLSSSFAVVTAHEAPGTPSRLDWSVLARLDTVVFLMTRHHVAEVADRLVGEGRSPDTPAACVSRGTLPDQRVVTGTLATLAGLVEKAKLRRPSLLVVGEVVLQREAIRWFESRPLLGRRIVVTRPREDAGVLVDRLEELGAETIEAPAVEIRREPNPEALDRALDEAGTFDWIVFTSRNGVRVFFDRLRDRGSDVRELGRARVAAIGPATADALRDRGLRVDLVPEDYRAEGLRDRLVPEAAGRRFLLARAGGARDLLPRALEAAGAEVVDAESYRSVPAVSLPAAAVAALREGRVDVVTFTSSSTVEGFLDLLGADERSALDGARIATIGPVTSETVRSRGLDVAIEARSFTIEGLVEALVDSLGSGR